MISEGWKGDEKLNSFSVKRIKRALRKCYVGRENNCATFSRTAQLEAVMK